MGFRQRIAVVLASFATATLATMGSPANAAPSFDCARATSSLDLLICAEPRLSALDRDMAVLYGMQRSAADADRDAILRAQRDWAASRSETCSIPRPDVTGAARSNAVNCLARAYEARVGWLSLTFGDGSSLDPSALDQAGRDFLVTLKQRESTRTGNAPTAVDGDRALRSGNAWAANRAFASLVARQPETWSHWYGLTRAALLPRGPRQLAQAATLAYRAFRLSKTPQQEARSLILLAEAVLSRGQIDAARASLQLGTVFDRNADLETALGLLAQRLAFTVEAARGVATSARPTACLAFNQNLPERFDGDYADFVQVVPALQGAFRANGRELCFDGVAFGQSYEVTVRAGLTSALGFRLPRSMSNTVQIPHREPSVAFRGDAYVLPKVGSRGLPLVTVNVPRVDLALYRINDRNLVHELNEARVRRALNDYEANEIAETSGALVWQGSMETAGARNSDITTAIPVTEAIGERKAGVYVLLAEDPDSEARAWRPKATQWIVVSDLGVVAYQGRDGLTIATRSLADTRAVSGARVALVARNNERLDEQVSDVDGLVRFAAGFLRGAGGSQPAAVMVYGTDGDFSFLDLAGPALDLSDRGAAGRPAPGPVDAYLYTERGIYRPGETVNLTTLLRDDRALGVGSGVRTAPVTLRIYRPDGTEHGRRVLPAAADVGGARIASLPFGRGAPTGRWTVAAHLDIDAPPLGQTGFLVDDFVPPRVELSITPEADALRPGETVAFAIDGAFLYGGAATGLAGEAEVFLEADPEPFSEFAGFHFGLVQEDWTTRRTALSVPETDGAGRTTARYRLEGTPKTSLPLRARLRATLFEPGGRPVSRIATLPVRSRALSIGLREDFGGGRVDLGADAAFTVVAVDALGEVVSDRDLDWSVYRENRDYIWYNSDGRWRWRTVVTDELVSSGTLRTDADGQSVLRSAQSDWGHYRVEVYDPETDAATSVRFQAGYSTSPVASATPDKLSVTLDRDSYDVGDTARLRLEGPFAGDVLLSVLGNGVEAIRQVTLPPEGAVVDLVVEEAWGPGVYVAATALRPAGVAAARGPGRAVGLTWMRVGLDARKLLTEIEAPEKITPRSTFDVTVRAQTGSGDVPDEAWVTLAAVDDGVLQLTGFAAPDPASHFLGKRALAVDLRDLYGAIINARQGQPGALSSGGDAAGLTLNAGPARRSSRVISLFSGAVALDTRGEATIPLEIPDFNGRLRLMAVAWSAQATGHADRTLIVSDPLVWTVSLPRFLAPGDRARISVSLDNRDAPPGAYSVAVRGGGAVTSGEDSLRDLRLDAGQRQELGFEIVGRRNGEGQIDLLVAGPDGFSLSRQMNLSVRPALTRETDRLVQAIPPGGALVTDREILERFAPDERDVVLSVTNGPNFDVPGLLKSLDLYPYGCLEQTTSRALPLLYLSSVARRVGAAQGDAFQGESAQGHADVVDRRLVKAIRRIQDMQRRDGWFALWRSGGPREVWLSAYVLDFLARARELGHPVDGFAFERGAIALRNWIRNAQFDNAVLGAAAYGAYVLARLEMIDAADLRYLHDTQMGRMESRLALAHLAAAHARYGDRERAEAAFDAAFASETQTADDWQGFYASYGSPLRDQAGLLVLAAEAGVSTDRLTWLETDLDRSWTAGRYFSTQEQAWMLLAAHALMTRTDDLAVTIDGVAQAPENGLLSIALDEERLSQGVRIGNQGREPVTTMLSVSGYPEDAPQPAETGFRISRSVFDLSGNPISRDSLTQRESVVVVIEGQQQGPQGSGRHRALVLDLLPAGLELENAAFGSGRATKQFAWLGALTETQSEELRDDRYVAALDLAAGQTFRVAYLARAVTPGRFTVPAVTVEDMYRPELFARGGLGTLVISPAP